MVAGHSGGMRQGSGIGIRATSCSGISGSSDRSSREVVVIVVVVVVVEEVGKGGIGSGVGAATCGGSSGRSSKRSSSSFGNSISSRKKDSGADAATDSVSGAGAGPIEFLREWAAGQTILLGLVLVGWGSAIVVAELVVATVALATATDSVITNRSGSCGGTCHGPAGSGLGFRNSFLSWRTSWLLRV